MKTFKFFIDILGIILIFYAGYLYGMTYTVTNTNDFGDGSLRDAMTMANNSAGLDTINFNIPGPGPHTIFPNAKLPILFDLTGVLIDGLSQPGASAGANPPATAVLMIEINGMYAGASHGFDIQSPNNTIRGLVINNFGQNGISILAISGGTYDNLVYCNFIGTDPAGVLGQGNGQNHASFWAGVYITVPLSSPPSYTAYHNTIEANLIADNYTEGVSIASCPPGDVYENEVTDNYIGTDITGKMDLGNEHDGVYIGERAHDNQVRNNLIGGNDYSGVGIMGYYDSETQWITYNNHVFENIIGLTIDFNPLPNTREGVSIGRYGATGLWGYATNNTIGPENIIACNGRNGILVEEHGSNSVNTDSNKITQNAIYDNTLRGIDLGNNGVTLNDLGDIDAGANQLLNFPVIDSAYCNQGQTTITGTINIDTNPSQAVVEIFKVKSDASGYGEGKEFIDSTSPGGTGNWNIVVTGLAVGDSVTATTTDNGSNTSEFCQNVAVTAPTPVLNEDKKLIPATFYLSQNFPNPFNNSTKITYQLPIAGKVKLQIYNTEGKIVRTLVDGYKEAGEHTIFWNGLDNDKKCVSTDVYVIQIQTESFVSSKKALLIK
ncbi:T9SS type A sorting domain-containing protein [bacterium]|nr:T9SS type A sorting domain-containing protein [bacterium]RQV99316.1 MAG: T9SS C-terminal target domain-containing protein [bacterium]